MSWIYTVSEQDAYNGKAARTFTLVAADYATARGIADNILAAFQNLSNAAVYEGKLSEVDTILSVADANSNIDEGITWQFNTGGSSTASINFPSPVKSVVNSDRSVDLADPLVAALLTIYTDGHITVSDGELVQFVIGGTLDK